MRCPLGVKERRSKRERVAIFWRKGKQKDEMIQMEIERKRKLLTLHTQRCMLCVWTKMVDNGRKGKDMRIRRSGKGR